MATITHPKHTLPTPRPTRRAAGIALALLAALGLARAAAPNVPLAEQPFPAAETTLVWVGTGESYVWMNGQWQRTPAQDYEFSVVQRRYRDRWESLKTQSRRHPAYDGSAGARDQVQYFRLGLSADTAAADVRFTLQSSFGDGEGQADREFRKGRMEFDARGVSMFAPFNRYRITQDYLYDQGELRETVELFKAKGGAETPFVKVEERASLMAQARFNTPPTRR
jgi:hypothetical protein